MHPFEAQLAAAWPPDAWQDVTVVLAVSGGADSVALLRAMAAIRSPGEGQLVAAHLNHQLRGAEADGDEAFVVELCARLGVACEVGRIPAGELAAAAGDGFEAAARDARYRFLAAAAARLGARYVATAHTADDQAETILHRILRGTGIGGLAGIARTRPLPLPVGPPCRGGPGRPRQGRPTSTPVATLIRPLLQFRREKLTAYLDGLQQPYRRDASNDDLQFTRNRIRGELLPQLAGRYNPGVVEALLRLGGLAGEVQAVIDNLVRELADRCVRIQSSGAVSIDAAALIEQPAYVVRELLMAVWRGQGWPMQAMGLAEWERLAAMLAATDGQQPPKQTLPGNVLAEAADGRLRLVRT
jgi:tRNA(Ile)-lysidine synthase